MSTARLKTRKKVNFIVILSMRREFVKISTEKYILVLLIFMGNILVYILFGSKFIFRDHHVKRAGVVQNIKGPMTIRSNRRG